MAVTNAVMPECDLYLDPPLLDAMQGRDIARCLAEALGIGIDPGDYPDRMAQPTLKRGRPRIRGGYRMVRVCVHQDDVDDMETMGQVATVARGLLRGWLDERRD